MSITFSSTSGLFFLIWSANATIQELCGFTKQQARSAIDKMRDEKLIEKVGKARGSKYVLKA